MRIYFIAQQTGYDEGLNESDKWNSLLFLLSHIRDVLDNHFTFQWKM